MLQVRGRTLLMHMGIGRTRLIAETLREYASSVMGRLVLTMICVAAAPLAWAAGPTPVSGPISTNTTWTEANSPYVLSDDVQVTNGAYLTIQAGVIVRMNGGAALTVVDGALSAQGTSDKTIVFTSANDVGGSPTPAAPGDWQALTFKDGTIDASSALSHVQVRYGHGIVIESASPALNDLQIDNNTGPAITLDLKASPLGQRLSATGNDLNGILVPAGEVGTDVVWALKGIPYVVAQGTVFVGQLGFRLTPSRLQLVAGVTGTTELSIPDPAPAGGLSVDLVSSVPSYASVPATVVIPAGERSAAVAVQALAAGTTTITASHTGFANTTATVKVVASPTLSLTPSSGVVGIGKTLSMTLALSDVAPAGGLSASLVSSNGSIATVPETVNVPAGTSQTVFNAQGIAAGTVSLTASASGYTNTTAGLTVRPVSLNLPTQFLIAPSTSRSLPITLSDPAPAGGLTINLTSANSGIATVPTSVAVPENATAINVDVDGVAAGTTTITATAQGYESDTTNVIVDAISISLSPSGNISIPAGLTQPFSVRLSKAAPADGVDVTLTMVDTTKATVSPVTVNVPQGQTVATQQIIVTGVAVGSTQLTASSPGLSSAIVPVQVTTAARLEFSRTTPIAVGKGLVTYYYEVYVRCKTGASDYAPPTPLTVTLTSSDLSKAIPATTTVTIPAGQSQINFQVTGVDVTASGVTIDASAAGYASPTTKLTANVIAPTLVFSELDGNRSVTSARDNFRVYWQTPSGMNTQTAAATQTLSLTVEAANPAGIVPGYFDAATGGNPTAQLTIAAGQTYSNYAYVGQPTAAGTYQIGASLAGVGSWTSAQQTVANPELRFTVGLSSGTLVVGKGLKSYTYDAYVRQTVNNQAFNGAAAVTVQLACASTSTCTVPATVTIPAGQSQINFQVAGIGLGASRVIPAATGYIAAQELDVSVVTPTLRFTGLSTALSTGTTDDFYVSVETPGAYQSTLQTAANPIPITLTSAAPNVATVTSTVTIPANQYNTNNAQLTAAGAGTTTVTASGTDITPLTSPTITVSN